MAGFYAYNCLIWFDPTDWLQSTSWSRIDKSEAQYKQQMGQSLVFVSMPPIPLRVRKLSKSHKHTYLFLSLVTYTEKQTAQNCCCFEKSTLGYMHLKWDSLSYRPEEQQHAYNCSSSFLGEERWATTSSDLLQEQRLEAVHKETDKARWKRGKEQIGAFPNAEQLLPKANPSVRSFEENV